MADERSSSRTTLSLVLAVIVLIVIIFSAGLGIGYRMADRPDPVSHTEICQKVEQEAMILRTRIDKVDSKIDILLNIATNNVARDFRR